jgi:hypothetical protein
MDVASGPDPRSRHFQHVRQFVTRLWSDVRLRVLSLVLVAAIAGAWYWYVAGSATLTIMGHHGFRRAEISIWVDGDLKTTMESSGSARKKLGIFQKTEGTFSKSLHVGAGDHSIRVRFQSLGDDYEITRQCHVNAEAGTESNVYVNADRGLLSLSFTGSPPAPASETQPSSGYAKTLQSIFMAIAGSALSATVGFVVQDFLKSRKAEMQGVKTSS